MPSSAVVAGWDGSTHVYTLAQWHEHVQNDRRRFFVDIISVGGVIAANLTPNLPRGNASGGIQLGPVSALGSDRR
jgi:hypothetical protein